MPRAPWFLHDPSPSSCGSGPAPPLPMLSFSPPTSSEALTGSSRHVAAQVVAGPGSEGRQGSDQQSQFAQERRLPQDMGTFGAKTEDGPDAWMVGSVTVTQGVCCHCPLRRSRQRDELSGGRSAGRQRSLARPLPPGTAGNDAARQGARRPGRNSAAPAGQGTPRVWSSVSRRRAQGGASPGRGGRPWERVRPLPPPRPLRVHCSPRAARPRVGPRSPGTALPGSPRLSPGLAGGACAHRGPWGGRLTGTSPSHAPPGTRGPFSGETLGYTLHFQL